MTALKAYVVCIVFVAWAMATAWTFLGMFDVATPLHTILFAWMILWTFMRMADYLDS